MFLLFVAYELSVGLYLQLVNFNWSSVAIHKLFFTSCWIYYLFTEPSYIQNLHINMICGSLFWSNHLHKSYAEPPLLLVRCSLSLMLHATDRFTTSLPPWNPLMPLRPCFSLRCWFHPSPAHSCKLTSFLHLLARGSHFTSSAMVSLCSLHP